MKTPKTSRSPQIVNKSAAKRTTKTADGGQLYVRGGAGTKGSYKVPSKALDSYMGDPVGRGTKSPRVARGLAEATSLSMAPQNKSQAGFAKKMGAIAEKGADASNKLIKARGDKKRR